MGVHSIDQIILSCNEDPNYSSHWKYAAWAYHKMFPNVKVHLAFLTNRGEDDELVKEFRKYGTVTLFKPIEDVPEFGQAKMIRFILASKQGNDVCYIDDVDIFPLRDDFITDKTSKRPKEHLLCVGGEVYNNNGCYPVSQMTAEGYIWKKFINPNDLSYEALIRSFKGGIMFDKREDIMIPLDFSIDSYFSDERLLRRLIHNNPVKKFEMKRGYENYLESTVDRAKWNIDIDKLYAHGYYNAHGLRPYDNEAYMPLLKYINDNY